jgi:hypothetical protein
MKRSIIINFKDGTQKELQLSKATKLNCDASMLHLDKLKDDTWRLIWSKDLIDDFSQVVGFEIRRE